MAIVGAFAVPHPPLIIPSVGNGRERGIQATVDAYKEVGRRVAELAPDTIVISSPHSIMYRNYLHISPGAEARGSFAQFRAPQAYYTCEYDQAFVASLEAACLAQQLPAGTRGEREPQLDHATMIPLHFIMPACEAAGLHPKVVRMGLSGLSPAFHYQVGQLVQKVADILKKRVVFVASGDLSHKLLDDGPYGFAPEGPEFDERVCDDFARGDLLDLLCIDRGFAERAAECGLRSFQIMAGALDRTAIRSELLSHEGPFGVGYGVAAFEPVGEEGACEERDLLRRYEKWHADELARRRAAEDELVSLARLSLESYVMSGGIAVRVDDLPDGRSLSPELLETRAGCFVSLKIDGELRGCIGTIVPTKASLAEEICANAVSAGVHDRRFDPVQLEELPELVYDVDVLGKPEPVSSVDELDPRRYGVIVSTPDGRRGLLLPDLDGVDTVEEQVRIAAQKGGIDLYGDDYMLQRFVVERHL